MKYLLSLLLIISPYSLAKEAIISIGYTDFTIQPNGFWYQKGYPYTLDTQSPSISLKYLSKDYHNSWQYGVEYVYVGAVDTKAIATPQDSNYDFANHQCISPCLPLATYYTKSTMQGVSLIVVKNIDKFSLTVGVMAGYSTNHVDVYGWSSELGQTPVDLHISHKPKFTYYPQIGIGYVLNKNTRVYFTLYPTRPSKGDYPAIYKGQSPNIAIGFLF